MMLADVGIAVMMKLLVNMQVSSGWPRRLCSQLTTTSQIESLTYGNGGIDMPTILQLRRRQVSEMAQYHWSLSITYSVELVELEQV